MHVRRRCERFDSPHRNGLNAGLERTQTHCSNAPGRRGFSALPEADFDVHLSVIGTGQETSALCAWLPDMERE